MIKETSQNLGDFLITLLFWFLLDFVSAQSLFHFASCWLDYTFRKEEFSSTDVFHGTSRASLCDVPSWVYHV